LRSRELGDQQSMADGDLVFQECLGHGRYEVSQSNTTVNVSLAFSRAGRDTRDSIDRLSEFQKRFETQSFLKRVNVLALEIFNALALDGLGIRQLDYADGKFFEFRQFRRSQATCPGYNLGHSVLTITLANTLRHREVAQAKSTSIAAPPNHPVRPRNHRVVLLSLPGVHPWPGLWAGDIYPAHTRIVDQFLELARC
jgi:hypothetical protein